MRIPAPFGFRLYGHAPGVERDPDLVRALFTLLQRPLGREDRPRHERFLDEGQGEGSMAEIIKQKTRDSGLPGARDSWFQQVLGVPAESDPSAREPVVSPSRRPTSFMRPLAGRNPAVREPVTRNPTIRDPTVRNPIVRDPFGRDPKGRDPKDRDPIDSGDTRPQDDPKKDPRAHGVGSPVMLRWALAPSLGLPRKPFTLWRRDGWRTEGMQRKDVRETVQGELRVSLGAEPAYYVSASVDPEAAPGLLIQALDADDEPIPGQQVRQNATGMVEFLCPGARSLRFTGQGEVFSVQFQPMSVMINAEGWQPVETVGLPVEAKMPSEAYASDPQGRPGLEGPPLAAALARLEALALLLPDPPTLGLGGVDGSSWFDLDPVVFLKSLRDVDASLMESLMAVLKNSEDGVPGERQYDQRLERDIPGLRQENESDEAVEEARVVIPPLAMVLLAAASDGETATGLGFGTIDLPPEAAVRKEVPSGRAPADYDHPWIYMVTAEIELPFLGVVELAALVEGLPAPGRPAAPRAETQHRNRPSQVDAPETVSVRLEWRAPDRCGYYLLREPAAGAAAVLNQRRPGAGPEPYLPSTASRTTFVDPGVPVPMSGNETLRYHLIGRDVFGRFGAWAGTHFTTQAPPVQTPGLILAGVTTHPEAAVPGGSARIGAQLEIEFGWDFSDRRPQAVHLHGRFLAPGLTPPETFLGGFRYRSDQGASEALRIVFDIDEKPVVEAGPPGTHVMALTGTDVTVRRYRVSVPSAEVDMTVRSHWRFHVWALGRERVRPGVDSEMVGPRSTDAYDPRPPREPSLSAELIWTAQPDATRRARALLAWEPVPGAEGYMVWEATEPALWHALVGEDQEDDQGAEDKPAIGTPPLDRANRLRDLISSDAKAVARSRSAFTRLNDRPLTQPRFEVSLPRGAETLYAYAIAAVGGNGVESSRSAVPVFVGVPRLSQPLAPVLQASPVEEGSHDGEARVPLRVRPAGGGSPPSGARLYRVTSSLAASELGLMGPPTVAAGDPGWSEDDSATGSTGWQFTDLLPRRWTPYYYRTVLLGRHAPQEGELAGASPPSPVCEVFAPPLAAPPVLDAEIQAGGTGEGRHWVVAITTRLPVVATPAGVARIRVARFATDEQADDGLLQRREVIDRPLDELPRGEPLNVLSNAGADALAAMPEVVRSAPVAGEVTLWIRFAGPAVRVGIWLSDPLTRTTAHFLEGDV